MMGRIVVPYADFSGGDWGRVNAWNAPQHSFDALNMYVTKTGELTVRPGLRNVTPTGVVAGAVTYLTGDQGADQDSVSYMQGGNAFRFVTHKAAALGSLGAFGVTAVDDDLVGDGALYGVTGGASIALDAAVTPGTGGGQSIAVYGNRVVTSKSLAVVSFSDVGGENGSAAAAGAPDFAHFTATNTLTIGDTHEPIIAIRAQRTHLTIFKANSIYVLTGDMRAATVRLAARTAGPAFARGVKRTRSEMLWWVPYTTLTPWRFDGTKATEYNRIIVPGQLTGIPSIASLPSEDQGLLILSTDDSGSSVTQTYGWLFYNNVWTKHTFPKAFQPFVAGVTFISMDDPGASTTTNPIAEATLRGFRQVSELVFADTGATPKFYTLSVLDRPGSETQPLSGGIPTFAAERAGDDSTSQVSGRVTFPEWHSPAGEDALVKKVIVDFRAFNTGGALTNHFDLNVTSLRQYNADTSPVSATLSYDEAGASASTGGTLERRTFSFGDQGFGNGFQISLTNVRGIALQRVTVIVDTQTTRGMG